MNVGGRYSVRDVSDEAQGILEEARPQIEAKLGYKLDMLKALQSIAAGANYFIKASIGRGNYVDLRILKDYPDMEQKLVVHSIRKSTLDSFLSVPADTLLFNGVAKTYEDNQVAYHYNMTENKYA